MRQIAVNSFKQYMSICANIDENRRRSDYVFRGLTNEKYELVTSLQRLGHIHHEIGLLRNFYKYLAPEHQNNHMDFWDHLVLGQHHGLPTRIMDWTRSPLVALHFALSNIESSDVNGAVWMMNAAQIHSLSCALMPNAVSDKEKLLLTFPELKKFFGKNPSLDTIDEKLSNNIILFAPPNISERILQQASVFSLAGKAMHYHDLINEHDIITYKIIIPWSLKPKLRRILDQLNINEATLFPGIEGVAAFLKRYYTEK